MRATIIRAVAVCAALIAIGVSISSPAGAGDHGSDLARVRRATSAFHRIDVAVANGYGELADLEGITCIEDASGAGGMGVHMVKGALVGDGAIDAEHPEALLYTPNGDRLLGVEYVVFLADWGEANDPPVLFGREFTLIPAGNRFGLPAFYELHAWVWHHNPSGMFSDWNPRIDC